MSGVIMSFGKHLGWGTVILMCMSGLEAAANPLKDLNDYKHALVEYYGAVGFHPLLQPEGHRVGDVIDTQTLMVVSEQESCFPGLQTTLSIGSHLPSVKLLENGAASFWMKLTYAFGMEMNGADQRQVLLNLENVAVESVALHTLQDTLDETCSFLQPIFEKNQMPQYKGRRVNVIASILEGRVNTLFSYSDSVQVEARLETLATSLEDPAKYLKKLAPELAIRFGLAGRVNIIHETKEVQTVAYRPATIFRSVLGGGTSGEIHVEPFDPQRETHQERLHNLARAWADSDVGE